MGTLRWEWLEKNAEPELDLPEPGELGKSLTIAQMAFVCRTAREEGIEAGQALVKRLRSESDKEPQENLIEKHFLATEEEFEPETRGFFKRLFARNRERKSA